MEQHPIPQQITSYEFKLVGEMTLKQFGKAAGGVILALIINTTQLVFFIKWPLIFIFATGGLAMAFVPFQDRPLETWAAAFLKSIYSPTIYFYKKKKPVNWLDIDLTKEIKKPEDEEIEVPIKESKKVEEFIESLPSVGRETGDAKTDKSTEEEMGSELIREKLGATGDAVFGDIPMPDIPDKPNIVVGMVLDKKNKIVEGAIVEIQDKDGNPARVLKTNQLGQFRTLTQLINGNYLVVPEKKGLEFDRVELYLEGKIIKPVKIIAK
ncbi:MAG: PrgI family protein [Candidatus Shapirobacteria bacterium]